MDIQKEAKRFATENEIAGFLGGDKWCSGFKKRNNLSKRAVTSVGQKLPADWEQREQTFRAYLKPLCAKALHQDIGNMDEMPVAFDMPGRYTVVERGSQDVKMATTGNFV